jgi:glycosyltransferase involved in cell wall biosynthesis
VPVQPSREFKFIVIGSPNYRKGFDLILEAAEVLTKQGFQFSFQIYGDGPLIEERSNFVYHGFKPHEEIVDQLSQADAFLLPSRYDGWGVALIEALAAGVPVITSRNVGASEVIVKDCDGIVLESLTVDHLAKAMASLIQKITFWIMPQPRIFRLR